MQSFVCKCGTSKCRGTLKKITAHDLKLQTEEASQLEMNTKLIEIKESFQEKNRMTSKQKTVINKYLKERKRKRNVANHKDMNETTKRLDLTSQNLPGTDRVSCLVLYSYFIFFRKNKKVLQCFY